MAYSERRQHERTPFNISVNYVVTVNDPIESRRLSMQGSTVDISAAGVCLNTDFPIDPGHVVTFGETMLTGVIKWGAQVDGGYRVGVELI